VAGLGVPRELTPVEAEEFLVADAWESPRRGGARSGGRLRALHFTAPDREIPYVRPEFDVTVAPGGDVTVTARTLVRDLLLQADRLDPDARADRGLVTLLPGEQVTIGVRGWRSADAAAARAALYCVEPA
jgi:beta-mannosidase